MSKSTNLATKAKNVFLKKGSGPKRKEGGGGGGDAMFGAKKKGKRPSFNLFFCLFLIIDSTKRQGEKM